VASATTVAIGAVIEAAHVADCGLLVYATDRQVGAVALADTVAVVDTVATPDPDGAAFVALQFAAIGEPETTTADAIGAGSDAAILAAIASPLTAATVAVGATTEAETLATWTLPRVAKTAAVGAELVTVADPVNALPD